ncbi:MAG: AMP-binding protein, partial [Gammaproteobacteria bacterium]
MNAATDAYEQARAEFEWAPPARFNFARDVVDKWGEADPAKLAIKWVDDVGTRKELTFAGLTARSRRLANALSAAGVGRGDTVVLVLGRNIEWWEIVTACLRMGAVCSPGTTQLSPKDIAYRMNAAEAVCFITDEDNAPKLEQVAGECKTMRAQVLVGGQREGWLAYDDIVAAAGEDFEAADTAFEEDALCYFTSGTTGYPKMTIHCHGYGLAHQITGKYWLDLKPDDLHW